MPAGPAEVLSINGHNVRIAAWRGSSFVGVLAPLGEAAMLHRSGLQNALDRCRQLGFGRIITSALPEDDVRSYLEAGFETYERLWLLAHPMTDLAERNRGATRRGRRGDRQPSLVVDADSFEEFWRLDAAGLEEARRATPTSRFRVVDRSGVVGYAVFGLAGQRGYLQRLAVARAHRGQGLASELVNDGLRWLARRNVATTYVNTQERNTTALALYQSLGFTLLPRGLVVLVTELPAS